MSMSSISIPRDDPSPNSYSSNTPSPLKDSEILQEQSQTRDCEVSQEGGRNAWLAVCGGFMTMFTTIGFAEAFGVYEDFFVRTGVASASQISWVGSVQGLCAYLACFPAGFLYDMGYCRATPIFGSTLMIFSLFMVSILDQSKYYQLLLALGFGTGIGMGFATLPALAIQSHYWQKKRPLALGLAQIGCPVGGIVYPQMLNHLFHGRIGYVWGVRVSAFFSLGVLVIANVLMVPNPPKLVPGQRPPIGKLLKDIPYILSMIGILLINMTSSFPSYYLQLDAILHGVSTKVAYYTFSIMNASSILGRVFPVLTVWGIGLFNSCIVAVLLLGSSMFLMYGAAKVAFVVLTTIIYGCLLGMWSCLPALLAASMAKDSSEVGVRIGLFMAAAGFGALFGPPLEGHLLGPNYDWSCAILYAGINTISAGLYLFIPRYFIVRKQGSWKV